MKPFIVSSIFESFVLDQKFQEFNENKNILLREL